MSVALSLAECPVVELRRYTLHTGQTPALLRVFERRLVEAQEQAGMVIAGLFRDEDDPDVFVWMRGFAGHEQRTAALGAFYGGPVWKRNAAEANATMIDSDDVHLLRPVRPPAPEVERGDEADAPRPDRLVAEVLHDEAWSATELEQVLGVRVAVWHTDPTPNGFPALPVHDERVVVWLASFPSGAERDEALARLDSERPVPRRRLLLTPTARSAHPAP